MANHVKAAMVNAITALKKLGWPKRRIARELGIDRETVTRYFKLKQLNPKPASNAPIGHQIVADVLADYLKTDPTISQPLITDH
jgi:transposase